MMQSPSSRPSLPRDRAGRSAAPVPSPRPQKVERTRRRRRGGGPRSVVVDRSAEASSSSRASPNECDEAAVLTTTTTSRRQALFRLGGLGLAAAATTTAAPATARAEPAPCPATAGVSFSLASSILRSAYTGFDAALGSSGRDALKGKLQELRRREYTHYMFEGPTREGERQRAGYVSPPPASRYAADVAPLLAALEEEEGGGKAKGSPSPSDATAVISPPLFDFALWSLFKAIAAELPPSQAVGGARSVLNAETGRALARAIGGDLLGEVKRQRPKAGAATSVAPFAVVAQAIQQAMERLTAGGYCCAWQVTYGDQPGSWPSDWTVSEPQINGDAATEAARTLERGEPLPLQLRVARPADVGASVALRNEEWGFCARLVPGLFAAFLEAGGYGALVSATVGARSPAVVDAADVYYSQDQPMTRPSSLRDQFLLALGDPMTEVIVAFTPETEVEDWAVVVPSAALAGGGGRVVAVGGG